MVFPVIPKQFAAPLQFVEITAPFVNGLAPPPPLLETPGNVNVPLFATQAFCSVWPVVLFVVCNDCTDEVPAGHGGGCTTCPCAVCVKQNRAATNTPPRMILLRMSMSFLYVVDMLLNSLYAIRNIV